MQQTRIDWADMSANPITGCRHGCTWCYARRMAHRLASNPGPGAAPYRAAAQLLGDSFAPALHLDVLGAMLERLRRSRRGRRVFLGSMSDVACAGDWGLLRGGQLVAMWPDRLVQGAILGACADMPGHTFQILTKNPINLLPGWGRNVHLGTSCPDTQAARDNVAALLHATGGSGVGLKWASVEPLTDPDFDPFTLTGVGWVVVGAESGPGAPRPGTHEAEAIAWAACRIRDWAQRHGVPVFIKSNLRKLRVAEFWPQHLPTGR